MCVHIKGNKALEREELVTLHSQGWKITAQRGTGAGTGSASKAGSAGRALEGANCKAKLCFLLEGHDTLLQQPYKLLRGDITSPVHKPPVPSLPHIFSGTLGFHLIYFPLLLSSCPMSAPASSYRQKTLIPSRLLLLQEQWKHKKAAQCLWRAGSEDAEGQSSRSLLVLH